MERLPDPVYVTRPILPERTALKARLDEIYDSGWLTNNGPLSQELERRAAAYLGVEQLTYVNNGTISLQLALRAFGCTGSVITSPFTYVATANAIALEGCRPVFADVHPESLCLDPDALAAALRPDTTAIIAVPVYGRPCDHDGLAAFAKTHGLKLIYDAAHAFGCSLGERSLASLGDAASLSFHATKPFHSVEGGALVTHDEAVFGELVYLRSHGHQSDDYRMVAPNAKNSELHAVVGLLNLERFEEAVAQRRVVYDIYLGALTAAGLYMFDPASVPDFAYNYAYAAVRFPDEAALLRVKAALEAVNVFPRRYFYPDLAGLPQFGEQGTCPVAADAAVTSLCLPLFPELDLGLARDIADTVVEAFGAPTAVKISATETPAVTA